MLTQYSNQSNKSIAAINTSVEQYTNSFPILTMTTQDTYTCSTNATHYQHIQKLSPSLLQLHCRLGSELL